MGACALQLEKGTSKQHWSPLSCSEQASVDIQPSNHATGKLPCEHKDHHNSDGENDGIMAGVMIVHVIQRICVQFEWAKFLAKMGF